VRNIYNGSWNLVPPSLAAKLQDIHPNNMFGEVIKVIMITSSGAEGINLRNTRYVHIVEPFWHLVRVEQVVGRARRIGSHDDLPEDMRTVKVFLYMSVLSEKQMTDDSNIELRNRDVSRLDDKTPVTTDETLLEGSVIKDRINRQILKAVKETSIDCALYAGANKDEALSCFGAERATSNDFESAPTIDKDTEERVSAAAAPGDAPKPRTRELRLISAVISGKKYQYDKETGNLYSEESFQRAKATGADLDFVGKLVRKNDVYVIDTNADP
jgi:hypothetical protein